MSRTVGVITNNANGVFQRSVIAGVREIARQHSLTVRVNALEDGPLDWNGMNAVIAVANVCTDTQINAMRAAGTAVTLVSHHIPHLPIPSLAPNNDEGVRQLVRHLVDDCGRRNIVFIRGDMTQIDAVERETAIRREMMRAGLPLREELFIRGDFEPHVARASLSTLLDLRPMDYDAVIAADYLMGVAALEVLAVADIDVPNRLSVVGFGDGAEAQAVGLTTVAADVIELGRRAARQVIGQLDGLRIVGQTLFSTQLIVRKTSLPI
jgi:DNA-binding LacI/PurR family transcriptional regulator